MNALFGIFTPQYIVKEYTNGNKVEHIINGGLQEAEAHYNLLFNNKPTDNTMYLLQLIDINKGIVIKQYDSITDS